MPIILDRSVCCDLNETISREWLVTNGLGGYASGTVAGTLTRMQHGLLVASPYESATPQLLLAKIDEEVVFDQRTYFLGTNEYQDGTLNPAGFVHLETFRLEEGFPIFTYRLGGIDGITLEKRIWMSPGLNTTYIQYRVLRTPTLYRPSYGSSDRNSLDSSSHSGYEHTYNYPEAAQRVLTLSLLPFTAYRPYHEPQYGNNEWHFQVQVHQAELDASDSEVEQPARLPKGVVGCTIRAWEEARPYHIFTVGHADSQVTFIPTGVWYWHFLRRHNQAAGLAPTDDLYLPGVIRATLWLGEDATLTVIVTAEELSSLTFSPRQLTLSYNQAVEQARSCLQPQRYFGEGGETVQTLPVLPLSLTTTTDALVEDEEFLRLLLQGAGRFMAHRTLSRTDFSGNQSPFFANTESIAMTIPGYYYLEESIRDTLIALPGLLLTTRRFKEAKGILRVLARHFRQGMLPDRLPTAGRPLEEQDYGSADTTLWYFYALDHYLRITHDYQLLDDLYAHLVESISWYIHGTYHGIQVDPHDKLLRAHQPGKALTWMNAIVNNSPVTPRYGKPVEVNALWYHALCLLHEWSQMLYQMGRILHRTTVYEEQSVQCKHSFNERFWYAIGGHLYDVIDGPDGDDTSIRPNQVLAVSLRYPVLNEEHQCAVMDIVTQHLLTPCGLRTLAPQEAGYQDYLKEPLEEQQRNLHQGSAWPWLIGPYIDALLRVERAITTGTEGECPPDMSAPHNPSIPAHPSSPRPNRTEQHSENSDTRLYQEYVWRKGLQLLKPFRAQLGNGMLGMIDGVFDGNGSVSSAHPRTPQVASALSMGEILRIYKLLAQIGLQYPDLALSV